MGVRAVATVPDLTVEDHGTIVLLRPCTPAAEAWMSTHLSHAMRFGGAVVVEPRYVEPILVGMADDGLVIA